MLSIRPERDKQIDSIDPKRRVITQGDLKYGIGDRVYCLLPVYKNVKTGNVENKLILVPGTIIDANHVTCEPGQAPRECVQSIRSSKGPNKSWAKGLTISNWTEEETRIQTMIQSYVVDVDPEYTLTWEEAISINEKMNAMDLEPYVRSKTQLTVPYRYVLGLIDSCHMEFRTFSILGIEKAIKPCQLYSGVLAKYSNPHATKRSSAMALFTVIDHYCSSPYDIMFVIECHTDASRILSIHNAHDFNVRFAYPTKNYHTIDWKESYEVVTKQELDKDQYAKKYFLELITQFEMFYVKKSLCRSDELTGSVYVDNKGNREIVFDDESPPRDYKPTRVRTGSYIRGLAYKIGYRPQSNRDYIFFDSKHFHTFDLDPSSDSFLTFKHRNDVLWFCEPSSRSVICGISFTCKEGKYRGSRNLMWFYPSSAFQALFAFASRKNHEKDRVIERQLKGTVYEDIYNIILYGLGIRNPTRNSKLTKEFVKRNIWWGSKEE